MYNRDREDQAKALDPMQKQLRKVFDDLEKRGEVYRMTEPNLDRSEALKFLADEGQRCDKMLDDK